MNRVFLQLIVLSLTVQLSAQPVITDQPVNHLVVWGGNATFSVMATGIGPLTYQWQLNGTNLPNNIITTVAGGNLFNNLPATNTILNGAASVAEDSVGNFYIADYGNHVIRKVDTNGMAIIVAGTGSAAFSGDGGAATNAGLISPSAVIVDPLGNLLISDSGNNRIRRVDTNGVISTVVGNGSPFILGDNGAATNAGINYPVGLCFDSAGNLFIADQQNHRIRRVDTNGIIRTVAGNGTPGSSGGSSATTAQLNNPSGVAVDSSYNLYIADSANNRIRKTIVVGTIVGNISTVAGTGTGGYSGDGGIATVAKLNYPTDVAVDEAHNLFIVDSSNHRIRKTDMNNIITTVAGSGTNGFSGDGGLAANANLSFPQSATVDSTGNLFIADYGNNRVRQLGTNGIIATVAGRALNDGDFAINATLNLNNGIAFDSGGNLYIADNNNNRIRKVDTNGIINTVAGNGLFDFSGDGGAATNATLRHPSAIVLDAGGNLIVTDLNNFRVRKVDANGFISTVAGNGTNGFSGDGSTATNAKISFVPGVAVDAAGNYFLADGSLRIRKVDTNGVISSVAGNGSFGFSGDGGAATNAKISVPQSVAFDVSGNLYLSDSSNNRIRKIDTNGIIGTVAGSGAFGYSGDGWVATNAGLSSPFGVLVDHIGNLFIADASNYRIRKVSPSGMISTVAGNGIQGFGGDGSSGNTASLSGPRGLAMDGSGNLYISDTGNNRVRKLTYVDFADQPSFTLANVTPASLSNYYSVIISDSTGSVTSSVVAVNLQLPPITPVFTASNNACTFTWNTVSNQTYQLQSATNLVAPNWVDLGSPVTAISDTVSVTNLLSSEDQRFYRARLWP